MAEANVSQHYELLHAMMRKENDDADAARCRKVLMWASDNTTTIGKVLDAEERRLFTVLWGEWKKHHEGPSRDQLAEMVHKEDKSEGMMAVLKAYDEFAPTFKSYDAIFAQSCLSRCVDDYQKVLFSSVMRIARQIVEGGYVDTDKKGNPELKGIKDARQYVFEKLSSGIFASQRNTVGGSMKERAGDLVTFYEENERDNRDNSRLIPTGIPQIDKGVGGLERGSFNLILGAAGQRKSAVARTMAYNAACNGNRVLFIPLEMKYKEEMQIFGILHGSNVTYFGGTEEMTIQRYVKSEFTEEEKAFLKSDIMPDLRDNIGDNLVILQPPDAKWETIRTMIEMEHFKEPLDLIVLDYFAKMDTSGERDDRVAINQFAKEAKDFVLYDLKNERGGVAFVTPAHGSRQGIKDAEANDGKWAREGIYLYSQLEKEADMVIYTFLSDDMQGEGYMKLGTCKNRRGADVPPTLVPVNHGTHRVGGADGTKKAADIEPIGESTGLLPDLADYEGLLRDEART